MKSLNNNTTEFIVLKKHLHIINIIYAVLPVLLIICKIIPPLKKLYKQYLINIFEDYAIQAYLTDNDDVGLFENFILKKGAIDKIIEDYEKRNIVWKKESLIDRLSGINKINKPEDFESLNVKLSLDDKKKAVLDIIIQENRIIQFFGKRIEKKYPLFYSKISKIISKLNE